MSSRGIGGANFALLQRTQSEKTAEIAVKTSKDSLGRASLIVSNAGLADANGTYKDVGQLRSGRPQWSKEGGSRDKIPGAAHADNGHIFYRGFDSTWNLHLPAKGLVYRVKSSDDRPPTSGWTAVNPSLKPTPELSFEEGFGGFDEPAKPEPVKKTSQAKTSPKKKRTSVDHHDLAMSDVVAKRKASFMSAAVTGEFSGFESDNGAEFDGFGDEDDTGFGIVEGIPESKPFENLLQVAMRQSTGKMSLRTVAFNAASVVDTKVFVLQTADTIYQFNAKHCDSFEQSRVGKLVGKLQVDRKIKHSNVKVISQKKSGNKSAPGAETEFWNLLGGYPDRPESAELDGFGDLEDSPQKRKGVKHKRPSSSYDGFEFDNVSSTRGNSEFDDFGEDGFAEEEESAASIWKPVYVEAATSTASNANVSGDIMCEFYVSGTWSDKMKLSTGSEKGSTVVNMFNLKRDATKIRLSLETSDEAWGYWKILVNGVEVCRDPYGEKGRWKNESEFWLGSGCRPSNTFEIPRPPGMHGMASMTLRADTSTTESADTSASVFVQFLVGDKWSVPMHFFTEAKLGEIKTQRFTGLSSDPTKVRMWFVTDRLDTWGYWKLEANSRELIKDPKGKSGSPIGKSKYWIGSFSDTSSFNEYELVTGNGRSFAPIGSQSVGRAMTARRRSQKVETTLEVRTSLARNAGTKAQVFVKFFLPDVDKWTAAEEFFSGAEKGSTQSKKFVTQEEPTKVQIFLRGTSDSWGYWLVQANGADICRDKYGEKGRWQDKSDYWIDNQGKCRESNTFALATSDSKPIKLAVATSNQLDAGTKSSIFVEFMIDGQWSTKEAFFHRSKPGETKSKTFTLPGQPDKFRLSSTGTDSWGYWKLSIDDVDVRVNPAGDKGSPCGDNMYWIQADGARGIRSTNEFDVSEKADITLEVYTTESEYAGTADNIMCEFLIKDKWTAPSVLCTGATSGEKLVQSFTDLPGKPIKLRFTLEGMDAWSYWKVVSNGVTIFAHSAGASGTEYGEGEHWIGGDLENSTSTIPFEENHSVALEAFTSVGSHFAATGARVNVQFFMDGAWGDKLLFFKGASKGEVISKKFNKLPGRPEKVKFTIIGTDSWGLWKVKANEAVILEHPDGENGHPRPYNCQYWVDNQYRPEVVLDLHRTYLIDLDIFTMDNKSATTGGTVFADFKVNDEWTGPQKFFFRSTMGQIRSNTFSGFAGRPTDIRLTIDGKKAVYGYWKLLADGKEIIVDSNGSKGSQLGENDFWIGADNSNVKVSNTFSLDPSDAVRVVARTSVQSQSGTSGTVCCSFEIDGEWSEPFFFFSKCSTGSVKSARFMPKGPPSRIKFSIDGIKTTWGYWALSVNGKEICHHPRGEFSMPCGENQYWIGTTDDTRDENVFDLSEVYNAADPEGSANSVKLEAFTANRKNAATNGTVFAEFLCDGDWTPKKKFFLRTKPEQHHVINFTGLPGPATEVRLSLDGRDLWGYWKLVANGKDICCHPLGTGSVAFGSNQYWIDGSGGQGRLGNVFDLNKTYAVDDALVALQAAQAAAEAEAAAETAAIAAAEAAEKERLEQERQRLREEREAEEVERAKREAEEKAAELAELARKDAQRKAAEEAEKARKEADERRAAIAQAAREAAIAEEEEQAKRAAEENALKITMVGGAQSMMGPPNWANHVTADDKNAMRAWATSKLAQRSDGVFDASENGLFAIRVHDEVKKLYNMCLVFNEKVTIHNIRVDPNGTNTTIGKKNYGAWKSIDDLVIGLAGESLPSGWPIRLTKGLDANTKKLVAVSSSFAENLYGDDIYTAPTGDDMYELPTPTESKATPEEDGDELYELPSLSTADSIRIHRAAPPLPPPNDQSDDEDMYEVPTFSDKKSTDDDLENYEIVERDPERERKEAEERARKEAEQRARKEAEERARKEAEERARKEAEERERKEAEERARKEAEERARKEAEERARKEAEERERKEAELRQREEQEKAVAATQVQTTSTKSGGDSWGHQIAASDKDEIKSWAIERIQRTPDTLSSADNGRFAVRIHDPSKNLYNLCVVYKGKMTLHNVRVDSQGANTTIGKKHYGSFTSINEIVAAFGTEPLPPGWPILLTDGASPTTGVLVGALEKPNPAQEDETDLAASLMASKGIGRRQSYDNEDYENLKVSPLGADDNKDAMTAAMDGQMSMGDIYPSTALPDQKNLSATHMSRVECMKVLMKAKLPFQECDRDLDLLRKMVEDNGLAIASPDGDLAPETKVAVTEAPKNDDVIIDVSIAKGPDGFGVKFGGCKNAKHLTTYGPGIFVSGAIPESPASKIPELEVGLQILEISGVDLSKGTFAELKTVLANIGDTLNLKLTKNKELFDTYNAVAAKRASGISPKTAAAAKEAVSAAALHAKTVPTEAPPPRRTGSAQWVHKFDADGKEQIKDWATSKVSSFGMPLSPADDGKFVVREHDASKGLYNLCLVYKGKMTLHNVRVDPSGAATSIGKKNYGSFKTLDELIVGLSKVPPPQGWPIRLTLGFDKKTDAMVQVQDGGLAL